MNKKRTLLFYVKNIDLIITGFSIITLVIITFLNVILRYGFNSPLAWVEEVQLWLFVWISFLGAGAAFRTNSHVGIEFIVEKIPIFGQKIIEIINYFIVIIVLSFVIYQSCVIVEQMLVMDRVTNILQIPNAYIYIIIPFGALIMIISYTTVFISQMRSYAGKFKLKE